MLYVQAPGGDLVPLSAVATTPPDASGPQSVNHTGQLPSVTLSFNLRPGVALGDAVARVAAAGAPDAAGHRHRAASRAPRRRSRIR